MTFPLQSHIPIPPPPPPPAPPQQERQVLKIPPPPPVPIPQKARIDWHQELSQGRTLNTVEEDVLRILQLPIIEQGLPRCPDRDAYNAGFMLPNTQHPEFRLRDVQIDAIWTYEMLGGLFGPQGVGSGKTLCTICSAIRSITARGHYRTCIIIPPQVLDQLALTDILWARERINFEGVPFHICSGTWQQRREISRRSGPGVWVYAYSSLSTKTGYEELKNIRASCYILDEAHNVSRHQATRSKRFHAILKELEDDKIVEWVQQMTGSTRVQAIELVAVSGTLTKKSIKDYSHLATRALGRMSPTPIHQSSVEFLGNAIDANSGCAVSERDKFVLGFVTRWARANHYEVDKPPRREDDTDEEYEKRLRVPLSYQDQLRQAFMHRLHRSPGVVATEDQGVDASLLISWIEPEQPDDAPAIQNMFELMRQVVLEKKTPAGDDIDYPMHQYKWLWELSAGFYNNLIWPNEDKIIKDHLHKTGEIIEAQQANQYLGEAKAAHQVLQAYHRELREFLEREHLPGCDTPMLVALEISRQIDNKGRKFLIPQNLLQLYHKHRKIGPHSKPWLPERYSVPVWVSDHKINAAMAWALEHKEGIIWFHHPYIGQRIHKLLIEHDIPHTYAPAGKNQEAFAKGLVIASYSHGTGKNLQHQSKNLFVELRREAHIMEQTLGRTHRSGQLADVVQVWLLLANGFDLALFAGILSDADYAQSTLGTKQRLCYADYSPPIPAINPRLMLKLGIVKQEASSVAATPYMPITPTDVQEIAKILRPLAYGKGSKIALTFDSKNDDKTLTTGATS